MGVKISGVEDHSTLLTIKIPDSTIHAFEYFMDSEEPLLPIGLPVSYDNDLPFVVSNPKPNSSIDFNRGDALLFLGPEDRKGTTK